MTVKSKNSDIIKHSAAHILAASVKRLHPDVKIGIGPVTKDGFYYDFYFGDEIPQISLEEVEKVANEIVNENLPFKRQVLTKEEGYNMLLQIGQIFKAELIQAIPEPEVSFYKLGSEFTDLCRGPHVASTKQTGIIKINGSEEVFWKDDPTKGRMLRIYGSVFSSLNEYNEFLKLKETLSKRDFFSLAPRLQLLKFAARRTFVTDKGATILKKITDHYLEKFEDLECSEVLVKGETDLESISEFINSIYGLKNQSYKSMPLCYKANLFSRQRVNETEIYGDVQYYKTYLNHSLSLNLLIDVLDRSIKAIKYFSGENLNVEVYCTNLEDEYIQTVSNFLQKNLVSHNKILSDQISDLIKIMINVTDKVGKSWKFAEINFTSEKNLKFVNASNKRENPLSIDFYFYILKNLAFLIEEYGGNMPFEFNPLQIECIPTSKKHYEFGEEVIKVLKKVGFRAELDKTSRSLRTKIRKAEDNAVPYIFIVGEKEENNKAVSIRHKGNEIGLVGIQNIKDFINENNYKL